jgi:hypothetical protein
MVENNMGVGIAGAKTVAPEIKKKSWFRGGSKARKSNGIWVWRVCAAVIIRRLPKNLLNSAKKVLSNEKRN